MRIDAARIAADALGQDGIVTSVVEEAHTGGWWPVAAAGHGQYHALDLGADQVAERVVLEGGDRLGRRTDRGVGLLDGHDLAQRVPNVGRLHAGRLGVPIAAVGVRLDPPVEVARQVVAVVDVEPGAGRVAAVQGVAKVDAVKPSVGVPHVAVHSVRDRLHPRQRVRVVPAEGAEIDRVRAGDEAR